TFRAITAYGLPRTRPSPTTSAPAQHLRIAESAHHFTTVARELSISAAQVRATSELLAEGATIPFIARYRKEATGSLDEVAVTSDRHRLAHMSALSARRCAIVASLEDRQLLTDDLRRKLDAAETLATLEDVYQPFRPKRRTRASVARDRGLEPLADLLLR